jgi:hypothetical protein
LLLRITAAACLHRRPASRLFPTLHSVKHNCFSLLYQSPARSQQQPQPLQPCTRAKQCMRLFWQVCGQLHCPFNMYFYFVDLL